MVSFLAMSQTSNNNDRRNNRYSHNETTLRGHKYKGRIQLQGINQYSYWFTNFIEPSL